MARRSTGRRAKPTSSAATNVTRTRLIWVTLGVGVIGLGALIFLSIRGPAPLRGLITFPRPSRGHDNSLQVDFPPLPPVGGTHHDIWQNCGIYDEPLEAENVVHSMEHGAVWISYQPELSDDDVNTLRDLVRGERFIVLSPYPGLQSPVVLTAWGVQLELNSVEDDRVEEFIDRYQVGPQTPERGATCSDGVGQPIG